MPAFLAAFRLTGNATLSARAAGVDRATAYEHRGTDPDFAAAWDSAGQEAADGLEEEARRRAQDGVRRVKFHQGLPIMVPVLEADGAPRLDAKGNEVLAPYVEHEYSDTLLIFLLKGLRPEKYRDNHKVEHTGGLTQTHIYIPHNGREAAPE